MAYKRVNWENLPSTNTPINKTNLNNMENGIAEIDNLDDILTWKKQSYTVNAEYITHVGYSDCYKMNGLVVFSFNFNVKEINGKDITLITGLPNCRSTRYVFGFAGNNTIAEGYITSNGELKNDGDWASGWYSGIVVYPGN